MGRTARSDVDVYRWLLWLYPRELRDELGDEMRLLAADLVRDRSSRGLLILALDLLVAVPRTRSEQVMHRALTPTQLIITLVTLTASLVVLTLVLGLGPVGAIAAGAIASLAIGLIVGQRSKLARSFEVSDGASAISIRRVLSQAWWAPLAALHGAMTIIFGVMVGLRTEGVPVTDALIGTAVTLAFGAAVIGGLVLRLSRPAVGSGLILLGTIWLAMGFWMVWPPLLAALIWVGVIASAISSSRRTAQPI